MDEPSTQIALVVVLIFPAFHGIQWLVKGKTFSPEKILDWCFRTESDLKV